MKQRSNSLKELSKSCRYIVRDQDPVPRVQTAQIREMLNSFCFFSAVFYAVPEDERKKKLESVLFTYSFTRLRSYIFHHRSNFWHIWAFIIGNEP